MNLNKYWQYKKDIFEKLWFNFEEWKKILDCWCWDWSDSQIFIDEYKLDCYSIDIYENENIKNINWIKFQKIEWWIYNIPFENDSFDYVFLHDVLPHIDEENQNYENHKKALAEIRRVCKKNWNLIIVEWNRFNPLFYPHMVKMLWHNHFRQSYFLKLMNDCFKNDSIEFKFFEAHFYPQKFLGFWKFYEYIMEKLSPKNFLAYNICLIKKKWKN